MKQFLVSLVILVSGITLQGCAGFQKTLGIIPPAPATENEYTRLPFNKITNPAFANDVKGKWVRTQVKFIAIQNMVVDLPPEYKQGWVRMYLSDSDDQAVRTMYAVIQKEKSDPVFSLKMGDDIEIFSYLVPITLTSALSGGQQDLILFRIESLHKIK